MSKPHHQVIDPITKEVYVNKLYSLKDNWQLLQPYLDHPEVLNVLNECMVDYCDQHSNTEWDPNDGPWECGRSFGWWVEIIDEHIDNDEEYKQAIDMLSDKYEYEEEIYNSEEYESLRQKYFEKHSPKKGDLEYYQLIGGCHWSAPFVAELLTQAFGGEVDAYVIETEAHSVACFFHGNIHYYADLLNDWESVEALEDFLESEYEEPMSLADILSTPDNELSPTNRETKVAFQKRDRTA